MPAMGLRASLLRTVLVDLPKPDSVLTEPDARWDELLGGRTGKDSWGRYSRGYGTTCAVTVDGWLLSVGGPPEMIDAKVEDGGSGFTPGAPVSRLREGAKKLGWLRTPVRGEWPNLRPGDIYRTNHVTADGTDGSHVGVILRVTPKDDGSYEVETADGGQGSRQSQSASRNIRVFRLGDGSHPVTVQSKSGASWLEDWIAVGGDVDDEDAVPATSPDGAGIPWAAAAAVTGVALLIAGAALYATPGKGGGDDEGRLFAVQTADEYFITIAPPAGGVSERHAFERQLAAEGFEVTDGGSTLERISGNKRRRLGKSRPAAVVTEMDVSVRAPRDAERTLRDLAARAGLHVRDIVRMG